MEWASEGTPIVTPLIFPARFVTAPIATFTVRGKAMTMQTLFRSIVASIIILISVAASGQNSAPNATKNAGSQPKGATSAPEQQAIAALKTAFINAYNAGKADAIAAIFAEDGQIIDENSIRIEGRKAVADRYTETFKDNPGAKIELRSGSLRFLSPDVAIEEGEAVVRDAEKPAIAATEKQSDKAVESKTAEPAATSSYTAIAVRKDSRWLISLLRDHPAPAANAITPHDRLQELKWMVGDWVEEGPDSISTSSCNWDDSGNFLIWKYKVQAKNVSASSGTTFIGWDPLTKQITSWVFDSEGGHGEASWSRLADNQWMAKASGILSDGRTASATQYIKQLGPDRASWTSLDRVAGGEPVPNISEYVLARKPQHAAAAKSSTSKAAINSTAPRANAVATTAEAK
jgi:uncharacterized protein (TIGR02246 family)